MGTWFWYHLKAKNALSLNMSTNSAAYCGIFLYSPKRKKMRKKNIIFVFGDLRSNKLLFRTKIDSDNKTREISLCLYSTNRPAFNGCTTGK